MESAVIGSKAIAAVFGKAHHERFFINHRDELKELGVIFKTRTGKPPIIRWAAFPCELIRWAAWKTQRGEII